MWKSESKTYILDGEDTAMANYGDKNVALWFAKKGVGPNDGGQHLSVIMTYSQARKVLEELSAGRKECVCEGV